MAEFHLAIPIHDIPSSRRFYEMVLNCSVGRTAERWVDINFWGHQVSLHLVDDLDVVDPTNSVDSDSVPVRHFGLILDWDEWHALSHRLLEGSMHLKLRGSLNPRFDSRERLENRQPCSFEIHLEMPSIQILSGQSQVFYLVWNTAASSALTLWIDVLLR